MSDGEGRQSGQGSVIKAPQDFFGGLLIVAVAVGAVVFSSDLPLGTVGGMGPGMMPRAVAVLLGCLGAVLMVGSLLSRGPDLAAWSLRGLVFVLAAILAFAFTVRPFGLAVAAPLALLIGALASSETRWGETIVFAVVMTALCIGLFKFALRQPIPLAPWLLGY